MPLQRKHLGTMYVVCVIKREECKRTWLPLYICHVLFLGQQRNLTRKPGKALKVEPFITAVNGASLDGATVDVWEHCVFTRKWNVASWCQDDTTTSRLWTCLFYVLSFFFISLFATALHLPPPAGLSPSVRPCPPHASTPSTSLHSLPVR